MDPVLIARTLAVLVPIVIELAKQAEVEVDVPSIDKLKMLNRELAELPGLYEESTGHNYARHG